MIKNLVKGTKNLQMVQFIKANILKASLKVSENWVVWMDSCMKANGKMDLKMEKDFGEDLKAILFLDNGIKGKQTDMGYILGQMVIDIKDSLNNA